MRFYRIDGLPAADRPMFATTLDRAATIVLDATRGCTRAVKDEVAVLEVQLRIDHEALLLLLNGEHDQVVKATGRAWEIGPRGGLRAMSEADAALATSTEG